MPEMVEIVNIVASADFGREFDLAALSNDLDLQHIQYEPETFPGLQVRLSSNSSVMTIFSTGSYTITGVQTESELNSIFSRVTSAIQNIVDESMDSKRPVIHNLACKGDLGKELDLSSLLLELGVEHTEYEPEQSPFLYYWLDDPRSVITISSSGQLVITGVEEKKKADRAFNNIREKTEFLLNR